jgi:hypothetical protein
MERIMEYCPKCIKTVLEEAGAKIVQHSKCLEYSYTSATIRDDGKVNICCCALTLDRAVAALRATEGRHFCATCALFTQHRDELAAANTEVAGYKLRHEGQCKAIEQMNSEIARLTRDLAAMTRNRDLHRQCRMDSDAEVARLRGLIDGAAKRAGEIVRD